MERHVRRYLEWMRARNYSPRTVEERGVFLKTFLMWCEGQHIQDPRDVTRETLEAYRLHLHRYRTRRGRKLSPASQGVWLLSVRSFFNYLVEQGGVLSNPAHPLKLPRTARKLPRFLSEQDAEKVLRLPDTRTALGMRDRAILETIYSSGIRRAELAALELADLDLRENLLRVRLGKGRKERLVPLGSRAAGWLTQYLEKSRPSLMKDESERAVFLTVRGGPFTENRLTGLVRSYVQAAGFSGSCHLLRHTMATLMHSNGADVRHLQEILGHSRLSTTALYTHTAISHLKDTHRRTHPAEKQGGGKS